MHRNHPERYTHPHTGLVDSAKNELRDFLTSRRARVRPADVGLPEGEGRRVAGLRREELAMLAGVSVDYYVRLEQGRSRNVSESVLDAVARALQLSPTERVHLVDLARPATANRRRPARRQRVRPAVLALLSSLDTQPAFVMGDRMDVLASNAMARALMGEFLSAQGGYPNLARYVFLDPAAQDLHDDWPAVAEETVAMLRFYAGRHQDDAELSRLVGDLSLGSPEFARFWSAHDVRSRAFGVKVYRHPLVGPITLNYEALEFPSDGEQRLCVYGAEPGSPSAESLRLLSSLCAPALESDRVVPPGT